MKVPWPQNVAPFESLVYARPDEDFVDDLFRKTRLLVKGARSADVLVDALRAFDAALISVRSAETLARIRAAFAPDGAFYREETDWFDKQRVPNRLRLGALAKELEHHRFRKEAEAVTGTGLFREARRLSATVSPVIETELRREAQLVSQLHALSISADGYSNPAGRHFAWDDAEGHSDDELRRRVYVDQAGVFSVTLKRRERLFAELIDVRTALAEKMGYRDFIEYGLVRYGIERSELGKRAEFRELVKQHIVPLCRQIRRLQLERLGRNQLEPQDYYFLMREVWPDMQADRTDTEAHYQDALTDMLSNTFGSYFGTLSDRGYVNYDQAAAKILSAPVFLLPDAGAIYLNAGDDRLSTFVPALFYATGIALLENISFYERRNVLSEQSPLLLRALAGTAFMFKSEPEWPRFLGRASNLAFELELTRRVLEIPLMCAAEAFEEQLYLNREWNVAKRSQLWHRLKRDFLPDEAEGDHLSVMPYATDWLTLDQLSESPLRQTEQAMAAIMVLAAKPFYGKEKGKGLELAFNRLLADAPGGSALETAMGAGFLSPFETNTTRMAAFSIAMGLGL